MQREITEAQRRYLREQMGYSHFDHLPPPNTLVVHARQHELIVGAVREFAGRGPVHMLDVGCGWGDFSEKLDGVLASYVGVEPSLKELGMFARKPGRSLVRGVGERLGCLKDRSRNFVLLNSVLDHCFDWRAAWEHVVRILAPGGLLVVSMENSAKLPVRVKQMLGREVVHEGHLSFWSIPEIERLLGEGFEVRERRTVGYLFGFHALTARFPLPLPLLRSANAVADAAGGVLAPQGGHIFFLSALRRGSPSGGEPFGQPFCCPACGADRPMGVARCAGCGGEAAYTADGILDAVSNDAELKAALGEG
jgi:ubiquinone/menaquinone biosynthesis C-methylase UbiE